MLENSSSKSLTPEIESTIFHLDNSKHNT